MEPPIPPELAERLRAWDDLSRWERAEIGRALRRHGWSYGEIRRVIPVPKGTLAGWCRGIDLTEEQVDAVRARTGQVRGIPRDTQWKRKLDIAEIRAMAVQEVETLAADQLWLAGTVMYWAEGNKADRMLALANSDWRPCRLFIEWTRTYHDAEAVFVLKLNLHADNDEPGARRFWLDRLELHETTRFYKTFVKPPGTGHRKNHLPHGVAQVRVRRSADHYHRTMAWIDGLCDHLELGNRNALLISPPGR